MDALPGLLRATLWTIILAAAFRRFHWSHTALRSTASAGIVVFAVGRWADNEVIGFLSLDGLTLASTVGATLLAFLFYEWRDRTGRDTFTPLSDRSRRWLKRNLYGALFFVALVVGVRACVEWQGTHRSSSSAVDSAASDRAVDSVLGGDR